MDHYDIKRFGIILAIQAEIEGMKAENMYREMEGHSLSYNEGHFQEMAEKLRNIAYCHNEQL